MRKILHSVLWVLPFISFLGGYQFLRFLTHKDVVQVPSVVGLHMHDVIKMLSSDKLNVRILAEKIDPDSEEGIIISQTPLSGRMVKPHQSIFLVITRKPPKPQAPALFGLTPQEARTQTKKRGIQLKVYQIESNYPKGTVVAQDRAPSLELATKSMAIFVSSGTTPIRIFPNLKGRTVDEVLTFFKPYGIKIDVVHQGKEEGHSCSSCFVAAQRPLAGSLVDITKVASIKITAS